MQTLRAIHRITMIFVVILTLYLGVTGTIIQFVDLRSIFGDVPALDPNIRAMREGFSGPPNFQVIRPTDYTAPVIVGLQQAPAALAPVLKTAREQLNGRPIEFLELRLLDGQPVAQIKSKKAQLDIDLATGRFLREVAALPPEKAPPDAFRNQMKNLHKFIPLGRWALAIDFVVMLGLGTLIVTGLWLYWKLYVARRSLKKTNLFWSAGGFWRAFHRHVSILATVFLLIVSLSGTEIAFETLYRVAYEYRHSAPTPSGKTEFVDGREGDKSSPLQDEELPRMLETVTTSYAAFAPGVPLRSVRLRYFAGVPQGVVITGEDEAQQIVFNSSTGQTLGITEPGYPPTGFPFGWHIHQLAKNVHRGDLIGLPGRFMSLFAGLALIYLSVSGLVMYLDMWKRRRQTGRPQMFWK